MRWIGLALLAFAFTGFAFGETAAPPRIRLRFDDNWKFKRDPLPEAKPGVQWYWKPASDVSLNTDRLPSDIDSGDWKKTPTGEDVFRNRAGYAWYRADLGTGAKPPMLRLHFEQVDDNAIVFINGAPLMRHEGWSDEFDVPVGSHWNPSGPNRVVVLVQNTGGPGYAGAAWLETPTPEKPPVEANAKFNDRAWRTVHLPHDYVVEGTFTQKAETGHGSLPVTTAWYRKTFNLPAAYKSKSVWIDFDGVYRMSSVYLNGHKLGSWPSGYASFRYSINRFANFGGSNVLAVRVDPRKPEGWWYEGGGIYRHVWLNVADQVHVRPWGTYVKTDLPSLVQASVSGVATIDNSTSQEQTVMVAWHLVFPNGQSTRPELSRIVVPPNSHVDARTTMTVMNPSLWSIDHPNLYTLDTTIYRGNVAIDHVQTPFGIRTFRYDPNSGFYLNGQHVELKGTCNHQDHAGVGIAMPDGLLEWRIKRLKEMGSNAYRCSHNPPAAELLDACDRLGMVVMDETRHLGDALGPKSPPGTGTSDLSELRSMVLRDRNHPSIIMWSLFNEEGLQGTPEGAQIFTAMRNLVRSLDDTRPCTGAMNGGWGRGITLVQDIQGFNYGIGGYDRMHTAFPDLPMFGSETASAVATRGIYEDDPQRGYVSAYDTRTPGSYAATAEGAWKPIADRPWMAGGFVWTGFDYKGEPSPYGWPCINSHFGIMDICGFPKDTFYYYQAWWGDKPVVHILPHWNWSGKEGKRVSVWAFSNGDRVELFLNGKSLGAKAMPPHEHVEWSVPYQPGWLVAKAYYKGKEIARDQVSTTGPPAAIRLKTSRSTILADEEDLSPVEVEIVDAKGRVVPTASNLVKFSVTGPAHVVGVGNGDPSSHEPDKATQRHAFNGLCMALVGGSSRPGTVTLVASSPGLREARLTVRASRR